MLGVSRQHVSTLANGKAVGFPEPEVELAAGRIWRREAVETWMSENPGRVPGRRPLCGFCGKGQQHEVKLVQGPELLDDQGLQKGWMAICHECIALAAAIVAKEPGTP